MVNLSWVKTVTDIEATACVAHELVHIYDDVASSIDDPRIRGEFGPYSIEWLATRIMEYVKGEIPTGFLVADHSTFCKLWASALAEQGLKSQNRMSIKPDEQFLREKEKLIPSHIYAPPTCGKSTLQYIALQRGVHIYDTDSFLFSLIPKETVLGGILYDQDNPEREFLTNLSCSYAFAVREAGMPIISNLQLAIPPRHIFVVEGATIKARYIARRKRDGKPIDDLDKIDFKSWENGAMEYYHWSYMYAMKHRVPIPELIKLGPNDYVSQYYFPNEPPVSLLSSQRERVVRAVNQWMIDRLIMSPR
jgi:hypothetical protein